MQEVRDLLAAHEPLFADLFAEAFLAAWLSGAGEGIEGLPPPPPDFFTPTTFATVTIDPVVSYPAAEAAARDLAERRLLTKDKYEQLDTDAKRAAFTVARVGSLDALQKIQEALVDDINQGGTLREFAARVDEVIGGTALAPHHVETVYRTNVAAAYSSGLSEVLADPLVQDEFPYLLYSATHDSRTRPEHLKMEKLGLDGTAVYRADDPIWDEFMPPWAWNCRCTAVPLSVEDAARRGVREAKDWLASGRPPIKPEHVTPPPFSPPADFAGPKRGIEAIV